MEPGLRAGRDGAAAAAAGGRGHRGPAGGHRGAARAALRGRAGRHGRGGLRARLRRADDAGGRVQPCPAMILCTPSLVWRGRGAGSSWPPCWPPTPPWRGWWAAACWCTTRPPGGQRRTSRGTPTSGDTRRSE